MGNIDSPNPNDKRSFLLRWVLANTVGLPVLLGSYGIGYFMMMSIAMFSDGASVGSFVFIFAFLILALSGAVIGGWLGLMQWLFLRKQISQAGRWILASSLGVLIGAPSSWLAYGMILYNRPGGFGFFVNHAFIRYDYIIFGVSLGLAIGISQWFVLKQQVHRAGLWIIALPICFTLGIALANFYQLSYAPDVPIHHRLAQSITDLFPNVEISNVQVLGLFNVLSVFTGLVGVGLITGVLLDWLLSFHKKQKAAL